MALVTAPCACQDASDIHRSGHFFRGCKRKRNYQGFCQDRSPYAAITDEKELPHLVFVFSGDIKH